ncbi:MAG TPA: DUF3293 domain-containing protein [Nocardioides sp.]
MSPPLSPLPSLRALVERTLTVADLVTEPLWTVDRSLPSADAASMLAARDFDVAGVAGEPITRQVTRDLLVRAKGSVGDVAIPILASEAVEKSLPLADLVEILRVREYVYILDNDRVRWLATRADLQAPAVSVVVLSHLVSIEVALSSLVTRHLGDAWFDGLSGARQEKVREIHLRKVRRNVATGLEDCLYFSDWMELAARTPSLRQALGFESRASFTGSIGAFANMRNDLAHGGTLLDGSTPGAAIDRFARVRAFAEQVWDLVEEQHERWDMYLATDLETADGQALTGPDGVQLSGKSTPIHVLTAWNPGSATRSLDENRTANEELRGLLERHGHVPVPGLGCSPDRRWCEESLVVTGMTRSAAAELADRFGQVAIFELTAKELLVVRSRDARVMRRRPRRATTAATTEPGGME